MVGSIIIIDNLQRRRYNNKLSLMTERDSSRESTVS